MLIYCTSELTKSLNKEANKKARFLRLKYSTPVEPWLITFLINTMSFFWIDTRRNIQSSHHLSTLIFGANKLQWHFVHWCTPYVRVSCTGIVKRRKLTVRWPDIILDTWINLRCFSSLPENHIRTDSSWKWSTAKQKISWVHSQAL